MGKLQRTLRTVSTVRQQQTGDRFKERLAARATTGPHLRQLSCCPKIRDRVTQRKIAISAGDQMVNLNDLIFFLELARRGRLMPAARHLHVDYTTVSRRVAELEKSVSVALFERKSSGFELTEEGHRLLSLAEKIEALALSVQETIAHDPGELHGRVRVTSMEGIAAYYLAEKFAEFSTEYPKILIELITERHLVNLGKREADISISFAPPVGTHLKICNAGQFKLCLYATDKYLARRGKPGSLDELQEHDFIDYVTEFVSVPGVHWLLDILEPESVVFRCTSIAAQQNAVARGRGIALLPLFCAKKDPSLVPVLPELFSVNRDILIAVHENIEYVRRVRAVTQFLKTQFEKDNDYFNEL